MKSEHGMDSGEERSEEAKEAKGKKMNEEVMSFMKKRSESALPHYTAKLKTYVNIQQKHRRADAARNRRSDNYCNYCKCSDKRKALHELKDGANADNAAKRKDDKNSASKNKDRDTPKRAVDKNEKSRPSTPGSHAGSGDLSDACCRRRRRRSCRRRRRRCRRRRRRCSRRRRRRSCRRRRRRCRRRRRRC